MAEKNNATCSICGKEYYKCISCKSMMSSTPWKKYCDTSEHYKVLQVIHGFNNNVYTKEEAKKKLQTIDLSDLNQFRDNIKKIVKDIMKEDKKQTKVEDIVVEQEIIATEISEASEAAEVVVEQPSYVNRRKKFYDSVNSVESVEDAASAE